MEKLILCGDYSQGVARIQCTNPECKYERAGSCLPCLIGSSSSPSSSSAKLYFRHNRRLFSEIRRLIFAVIERLYNKAAIRPIQTRMVLARQSSGEFCDGTRTFIASGWRAFSMSGASLSTCPSGTSTECQSTSVEWSSSSICISAFSIKAREVLIRALSQMVCLRALKHLMHSYD